MQISFSCEVWITFYSISCDCIWWMEILSEFLQPCRELSLRNCNKSSHEFLSPLMKSEGGVGILIISACMYLFVFPPFPTIIWKSNHNSFQTCCTCYLSLKKLFDFWSCWLNLLAWKWKWLKLFVSNHYLENLSPNTLQTWGLHFLCQYSFFFGLHWPNLNPLVAQNWLKMVEIGAFWPLCKTIITQFTSNLECKLIEWGIRNELIWSFC